MTSSTSHPPTSAAKIIPPHIHQKLQHIQEMENFSSVDEVLEWFLECYEEQHQQQMGSQKQLPAGKQRHLIDEASLDPRGESPEMHLWELSQQGPHYQHHHQQKRDNAGITIPITDANITCPNPLAQHHKQLNYHDFTRLPIDLRLECLSYIPQILRFETRVLSRQANGRIMPSQLDDADFIRTYFGKFRHHGVALSPSSSSSSSSRTAASSPNIYLLYQCFAYDAGVKFHHFPLLVNWRAQVIKLEGYSRSWMVMALQSVARQQHENAATIIEPDYSSFHESDSDEDDYRIWNRLRNRHNKQMMQNKQQGMEVTGNSALTAGGSTPRKPVYLDIVIYRSLVGELAHEICHMPSYLRLRSLHCKADDLKRLNLLVSQCLHLKSLVLEAYIISTSLVVSASTMPILLNHPTLQSIECECMEYSYLQEVLKKNSRMKRVKVKKLHNIPTRATPMSTDPLYKLRHISKTLKYLNINGKIIVASSP